MLNMLFASLILLHNILTFNPAFAEEEPHTKQPLTFVVGVENINKLPLYGVNERGEFLGIYRKILDRFSEENNIIFTYKPYKTNDLFNSLLKGEIDFKFPDNPIWRASDKKNHSIVYSDPIYLYVDALFVKPQDINKTIDQFHSIGLVGEVPHWAIHHYVEVNTINIKRDQCKKLIKQLLASEIEGIMCNYCVMKHSLHQLGIDNKLVPNFNLPHVDDYYFFSSLNHPDIIQNFNIWLKKYKEQIRSCHSKYYYNKDQALRDDVCIFE